MFAALTFLDSLKTNRDIPSEIFQWLLSKGFACELMVSVESDFPMIAVAKGDKVVLEIKIICAQAFNSEKTVEEFSLYQIRQEGLRNKGVHSVILWEDYWIKSAYIVESRIGSLLGISDRIPARLTQASRIDKQAASAFLKGNHLQGYVSSKYRFGLFLPKKYFRVLPPDFSLDDQNENLLVAVATYSQPRIFNKNDQPFRSYELIRFASLLDITVVGGMDKLLSAFVKDVNPDDIMTYVDLEWSDGAGYEKLGFERKTDKPPITFLIDIETNERFSLRNAPEKSGLIEIHNAGSRKFVRTIKK